MARPRIIDKDKGWKKAMHAFKETKAVVEVGIMGAEASEAHRTGGGQTIAAIMGYHEFGVGVPRRSWLRDWYDERVKELYKKYRVIASGVGSRHFSIDQALDQFGSFAVGDLQKRWSEGIPPPLEQETIDRKGSSVPLIDTGQSRSSVTFRVKK